MANIYNSDEELAQHISKITGPSSAAAQALQELAKRRNDGHEGFIFYSDTDKSWFVMNEVPR